MKTWVKIGVRWLYTVVEVIESADNDIYGKVRYRNRVYLVAI